MFHVALRFYTLAKSIALYNMTFHLLLDKINVDLNRLMIVSFP